MILLGYSTGHIIRDIVEGAARVAAMWLFRKVCCRLGDHRYHWDGELQRRCPDCGERLS
jgi:hypothetical protein